MKSHHSLPKKLLQVAFFSACLGLIWLGIITIPVKADQPLEPNLPKIENSSCLYCHTQPGLEMQFSNGDTISVTVDEEAFYGSVHGSMDCMDCHPDIEGAPPHGEISAQSSREYSLSFHDSCKGCHPDEFNKMTDSVHEEYLQAGNEETPVCADCHQPHGQLKLCDTREEITSTTNLAWIPNTCANCHQDVYDAYAASAHGAGLLQGNQDMPTCIDCHSVHDVCGPHEVQFRLSSIQMCAECHSNPEIIEKYGLSGNVINTYMVFHNTTVTLLEDNTSELKNKPTCYDCHGVHDVGGDTPPHVMEEVPGPSLYPSVESTPPATSTANVGVTGAVVGFILGGAGTLTIRQLFKERKENEEETKE